MNGGIYSFPKVNLKQTSLEINMFGSVDVTRAPQGWVLTLMTHRLEKLCFIR